METALARLVVVKATARTLVIVKSAARTVVETALTSRFVIIKTAARSVIVVEATARTLVETALTSRFVIIKTTARTLVIVKSTAGAVVATAFTVFFVVEAAAGAVTELTVAEPAVATVVIKSALTSRLVAKASFFTSFLVTVTVIEFEGSPLLEHFRFINRLSGARTLARSFVVSHLVIRINVEKYHSFRGMGGKSTKKIGMLNNECRIICFYRLDNPSKHQEIYSLTR